MNLSFYTVNSDYCDYLRKFDRCVPYTMEQKCTRPFIGVLLRVNDYTYYAPLSSPKPKHQKMKNQIDFLKINNGVYGAINFNNMIPIIDVVTQKINPNALHRSYDNDAYRNLLNNQLSWCNSNKKTIISHAEKLYSKITEGVANQSLKNRCCNFKLLEQKCREYIQAHQQEQQPIFPNHISNTQDFGGFTQNMN
ncbi:MAG: type III toxin-antitoxin system ToxN/AbiQ family toxin [Ruminococcus sp.]